MASIIACSLPATIRASSGPGSSQKPDPNLKKHVSSSASWWAPLFGWSSNPDYVEGTSEKTNAPGPDPDPGRVGQRISIGCFTEEKARQLRRKTAEISSFHDKMYHSAIASRMASDVSGRSEK